MKTVVIYHRADFDGIFCREIARKFIPDAELIGWDYGDPEPEVSKEDQLYILDLSVPGLMNHPNLIWIDHHKSAIEKYPDDIEGVRVDGVAACRLAWQWFSKQRHYDLTGDFTCVISSKQPYIDRLLDEPRAVRLAGEYDIWDRRDPEAELFQHGLRSRELTEQDWRDLLATTPYRAGIVDELLESGRAIQYYRRQEDADAIKRCGYTLEWEGLKFLACNAGAPRFNSFLFTAGLKPDHDACLGYRFDGKKWSVSLYHAPAKEHHDLSEIAAKYGGGGHRGACGFTCQTLPFSI